MSDLTTVALRDVVLSSTDDEWTRLVEEVQELPDQAWTWQPAPQQHSIGWHVRHVAEWRYLIVHGIISELPLREKLYCLGWEKDPEMRKLSANPGIWFEPTYKAEEQLSFVDKIRQTTNTDIAALHSGRFLEEMVFPGGRRPIFDELMFQGLAHTALHRGQIRELKKAWQRRDWAETTFRNGWMGR